MAAAVAVPLIAAGIGAGASVWTASQNRKAAERNKPAMPPAAPIMADQAPLDAQAVKRRRAAAGFQSTVLTGPQGLKTQLGA